MASSSTYFCPALIAATPPSSSLRRKFKVPAKPVGSSTPFSPSFGATSTRASYSRPKTNTDDVSDERVWNRRGLVFSATLPFLLPFCNSLDNVVAKAAESGKNEYQVMKDEIRKVVPKGRAAGVLRLVFHDAGTFDVNDNSGGMNGSIRFELERAENIGLKGPLKIVEKAKTEVDSAVQRVSWADVIAVAGAEAVSLCGGPTIPVALGRLDSTEPDPEGKLPQETQNASALKQGFQRKGLSVQDLVALSGAHTLGSKGFGDPNVFDNSYFKILLEKPLKSGGMSSMVGLPSDRALAEDDECLRWMTKYANDQDLFFEDFGKAYVKLVNSGAKWKSS
ncbi:putative L-ascorbate peroxidase 6 isoform X2 [Morus notabilis]|uniref:putative L-ascorbate peroxidase 6 isoform X2 n=1 Tax=Morus notabilis TaxID=981085 RepID=UPI000CED50F4|nr:putative L-ascorbate peroxidase 6 isoform X2 [Morus notabilis]